MYARHHAARLNASMRPGRRLSPSTRVRTEGRDSISRKVDESKPGSWDTSIVLTAREDVIDPQRVLGEGENSWKAVTQRAGAGDSRGLPWPAGRTSRRLAVHDNAAVESLDLFEQREQPSLSP
ncbi:hypothetical protein OH76DRAFT_1491122 [Lentinus brumalis]|uniref:Uncharacterized protein n=1 Tax=Lentinus brumalis TaxID=2498619 RepID=A0A371CGQ8_9APHY|nr:hypothetical protein OH76DRAFT_1491122 [Polyporus brumalis]